MCEVVVTVLASAMYNGESRQLYVVATMHIRLCGIPKPQTSS